MKTGSSTPLNLALCLALPIYGLLAASTARSEVTFLGDWTDFGSQFQLTRNTSYVDEQLVQWTAGNGPNHWSTVQEVDQDRLQVEVDKTSPNKGAVLHVEVHPGDSVGYTGERSEVSHMLSPTGAPFPVTVDNGHEFYGVSIKLDPNWEPPLHDKAHGNWQWGIFMQLHSPDSLDSPPAFAMTATDQFGINTLAGDLIGSDGQRRNATSYTMTNGSLRVGHWVQFIIEVVWAYDKSGSLTIYRKDEGNTVFTTVLTQTGIPTLQYNSQVASPITDTHYWKAGFYRSISVGVTSRLWLGPIVRGMTMKETESAAFSSTLQSPMAPTALVVTQ